MRRWCLPLTSSSSSCANSTLTSPALLPVSQQASAKPSTRFLSARGTPEEPRSPLINASTREHPVAFRCLSPGDVRPINTSCCGARKVRRLPRRVTRVCWCFALERVESLTFRLVWRTAVLLQCEKNIYYERVDGCKCERLHSPGVLVKSAQHTLCDC